jgi:hypothetical protein
MKLPMMVAIGYITMIARQTSTSRRDIFKKNETGSPQYLKLAKISLLGP